MSLVQTLPTEEELRQKCIEMGLTDEKIIKDMTESVFKFYERGMKDVPIYYPDKYSSFEEWDKCYTKWKEHNA
jgi:hypothetical protein